VDVPSGGIHPCKQIHHFHPDEMPREVAMAYVHKKPMVVPEHPAPNWAG
jgi:hypothetical protein